MRLPLVSEVKRGRTLAVRRQVQREVGGGVEVRAPKYNSERSIYLPDGLVKVLSAHVAAKEITGTSAWMFEGRGGNPHTRTL